MIVRLFFYQISTLTDKVDTFETVGNATVKGLIGGGVDATWGVADTIAGGTAGSKMDLTAIVGDGTANPTGNVSTIGRSTSGIETFNITFKDADAVNDNSLTVDTSSLAGAKNFNIVSATASTGDKVKFDGLAQDQMVTIKSAATQLGVELNYSEAAKAGKEDVASFSLHNAKALEVVVDGGMEAVKITATGDNEVGKINANGATKFELSGAGSLDAELTGGAGNIAEINASTATGSLDLTVTTAHLNTTKATIKGGTATDDVLNVNGDINAKMTVSGFETVGLNGREHDSATPITFDMSVVTGATTVANFDNDSALTVKNATGVTNLLMGSGGSTNVTSDMGIGAITFEAKALQDKLDVAINNAGVELGVVPATSKEGVIKAGALNISNVKAITINAADADVVLGGLIANKMESLTVTAAEDFSITGAVAFHKDATVNMAGVKGDVTMTTGALTTALDYTGSLAADHLTLGTLTGTDAGLVKYDINTGAGNDEVILSGAVAVHANAALNLNLGEGNDTLTVGAAAVGGGQTIDFGTGTNTLVYTGAAAVDLSTSTVSDLQNIKINGTNGLSINATTAKGLESVVFSETGTLTVQLDAANVKYDASTLNLEGASTGKLAIIGTSGVDEITAHRAGGTITGGLGADKITLGTGVDTVNFTVSDAADKISSFTTTSDKMHFAGIALTGGGNLTATAGTAITASAASALANNSINIIADGATSLVSSTGTETIADYNDLTDVSAYLGERFTTTADKGAAVFVINDLVGDKSYIYLFDDHTVGTGAVTADDLKLIGVVTESAGTALVADDIA